MTAAGLQPVGSDGAAVRHRASGSVKADEGLCCAALGPTPGCKQTAPVAWLGPVLTSLVGTREDFNQMSPETRIWE